MLVDRDRLGGGRTRRSDARPRPAARAATAALAVAFAISTLASPALAAPALLLSPTIGPVGTAVTATGTGFTNGPVRLCWDGAIELAFGTVVGGSFSLMFTVPPAVNGPHEVRATTASFCAAPPDASATFTVGKPQPTPTRSPRPTQTPTPSATIKPPTAPPPTQPPPTATPGASDGGPSAGPSGLAIPTQSAPPSGGPIVPLPSFPLTGGPSLAPTPYPALVASLLPIPPDGFAASPGPFPDLDILAIEVTQGIQDLNNNMPLVSNRRTYARVYLDVIGQNELAHTYGALEARRNGQQIGWIWPENGPITATANGGNRLDLDDSLYFRLPNSWLHGTVTLTAFVYSHDVTFPWTKEPAWENNLESETVTFHAAEPLDIHLVTIHLHRSFHPTDVVREYTATFGGNQFATENGLDFSRVLAGFWRYHPISNLIVDAFPVPIKPTNHASGDEWDLGPCATTVVEEDPQYPGLMLASWGPFMADDGLVFQDGQQVTPDRDTLYILDREYTVGYFYVRPGGRAQVFGSNDGVGPAPIVGAPAMVRGCPNPSDESGQPNSTVALFKIFYDWADSREFFVSMVSPLLPTKWGGLASTLDTAWVKMNPNTGDASWYYGGSATIAHEVAHLTGLDHVACSDNDHDGVPDEIAGGPVDQTHPQQGRFPACSLAEVRDYGYYGFDVYYDAYGLPAPSVVSNDPNAPVENRAWPMLSYKSPRWVDPYHYCRLLVYYGVPCDPDTIDEPWLPPGGALPDGIWLPPAPGAPAPPNPGLPILVLSGSVARDGSAASVEGLLSIDDPSRAVLEQLALQDQLPPEAIVAHLVARDADGQIIADIPIPTEPLDDAHDAHGFGTADPLPFDLLLPLDPAIAAIEVVFGGETKASLPVSATAPTARWTSLQRAADGSVPLVDEQTVVTFEASDADGDPLSATLLYSADGEHWQVVATGVGDAPIPIGAAVEALPGSEAGTLRLLVSDGVHTTTAADEPTVRLPNLGPVVHIDAPTLLLTLPLGGQVVLEGSAFDREDRDLADESFAWSSSIDGPLGTGREIRTRELTAGRHTIVLAATDSAGTAASASIEVIVDGSVVQPVPGAAMVTTVGGIFDALAAGEDPAPDASGPAAAWLPPVIAGLLLVMALAIAYVVRRKTRKPREA